MKSLIILFVLCLSASAFSQVPIDLQQKTATTTADSAKIMLVADETSGPLTNPLWAPFSKIMLVTFSAKPAMPAPQTYRLINGWFGKIPTPTAYSFTSGIQLLFTKSTLPK